MKKEIGLGVGIGRKRELNKEQRLNWLNENANSERRFSREK
jgi:hypothetical protein